MAEKKKLDFRNSYEGQIKIVAHEPLQNIEEAPDFYTGESDVS